MINLEQTIVFVPQEYRVSSLTDPMKARGDIKLNSGSSPIPLPSIVRLAFAPRLTCGTPLYNLSE